MAASRRSCSSRSPRPWVSGVGASEMTRRRRRPLSTHRAGAKADAICKTGETDAEAVKAPASFDDANVAADYFEKIVPLHQKQTDDLAALKPDADGEGRLGRVHGGAERQPAAARHDPRQGEGQGPERSAGPRAVHGQVAAFAAREEDRLENAPGEARRRPRRACRPALPTAALHVASGTETAPTAPADPRRLRPAERRRRRARARRSSSSGHRRRRGRLHEVLQAPVRHHDPRRQRARRPNYDDEGEDHADLRLRELIGRVPRRTSPSGAARARVRLTPVGRARRFILVHEFGTRSSTRSSCPCSAGGGRRRRVRRSS